MRELESTKGTKAATKFMAKNLEQQMRQYFPKLRADSRESRIQALDDLMKFSDKIFEAKNDDLMRLLVDRLDSMADAEADLKTFSKVIEGVKSLYVRCNELKKDAMVRFISKKFSKHLVRKEAGLLEKKRIVIKTISEIKDENYVPELVSLLWSPGTFVEAREALTSMAEFASPLLIDTLKETDDRSVRLKIIDVLIHIGVKGVPEIEKLLKDPEWYVRRNGVYILGELKEASVVDKIGDLIEDPQEQVQLEVIESLNKIGENEKAKLHFKRALNSKFRSVVIKAIKCLGKDDIGVKIPDLVQWLRSRKGIPNNKEEKFRQEIIGILGAFGDDTIIEELVNVLNEKTFFKANLLQPTKVSALNALATMSSQKAIQALREAAKHKDNFVAAHAQDILKRVEAASS
jgi:HEAT repeat protein